MTKEAGSLGYGSGATSSGPQAFLVLGMHRSGTSAMARLLAHAGFTAPNDLIPPAPDNPLGFYEGRLITDLNEEIFSSLGVRWDDPGALEACCGVNASLNVWLDRARSALRASYPGATPILLKDPRVSLLAPVWKAALELEGYAVSAVVMARPVAEICASLAARNGMPATTAQLLFVSYMVGAEFHTRSMPRTFIGYDHLLQAPGAALEKALSLACAITPMTPQAAQTLVDRSLRHHEQSSDQLRLASAEVVSLDRASASAARTGAVRQRTFDRCRSWLGGINSWLQPIVAVERAARRGLETEIAQHKAFEEHLNRGVEELRGEIARLTELSIKQHEEVERLTLQARTKMEDRSNV